MFNRIVLIAILSVAASVAHTVVGGQDVNFDLLTYHYYLGYSALAPRLSLDFLPASFQGYQPPWPYALLYLLDSVGTPPVINASLHASIHALNLVLLFLLTECLVGAGGTTRGRISAIAFWMLGAIAPVYWYLVGTSYADLTTSTLVLGGLWLVARAATGDNRLTRREYWGIAAGAALMGAATGLRLHNAIYVAGLFIAVALARYPHPLDRLRVTGTLCVSAGAGWLLCFWPWAWQVYREFGNPLFPFYNGVFRSADFPAANLPLTSFVPDNLADLITLPFRMATYAHWVYVETRLPDIRPGLLAVLLVACGLLWVFLRLRGPRADVAFEARAAHDGPGTALPGRVIEIFFAASAILWLATSSNARYGVALFLLGGPVCGAILSRLLPFRYVLLVVVAVLLWQSLLHERVFRQHRVQSMPWGDRYFDWNLPSRLVTEPATFLSFGSKTASTLAPRVHPESAHVNLVGQYTPSFEGSGSARIKRTFGHPLRRIYGIFDFAYTQQSVPGAASIKTYFSGHLRLWGLDFTDEKCALVTLRPGAENWERINRIAGIAAHRAPPILIACELRRASPLDQERAIAEFRGLERKLKHFGAACPEYFGKPLTHTRVHRRWIVSSFATFELTFDLEDEGAFYLQQMRPPYVTLELGRLMGDDIMVTERDCKKWFSRLAELSAQRSRAPGGK